MKFCSQCGSTLVERVPDGDDRPRSTCSQCAHVHYVNPTVVVGCLIERGDEVLLCRRAIEPRHGYWTAPAGYLELGESMVEGACRETHEEAGAQVEVVAPHAYLDLVHIGQVYAMFRGCMTAPDFAAGVESLECRFFAADDIPWSDIAFPAVGFALRLLLEDRARGQHNVHHGQIRWNGAGSRFDAANYDIVGHFQTPGP